MRKGGKSGLHTEGLGFIHADMHEVQRAYPDRQVLESALEDDCAI